MTGLVSMNSRSFLSVRIRLMKRWMKLALIIATPLAGLIAGYLLMGRSVQAVVDGQEFAIHTRALTVGGALRDADITIHPGDQVIPALNTWLSKTDGIKVNSTRLVRVLVEPGNLLEIDTALLTPREILLQAGLDPGSPADLMVEGQPIPLDFPLQAGAEVLIQYKPAAKLLIILDGKETNVTTTAATIGEALREAGITLRAADRLSIPVTTALTGEMEVLITTGQKLTITVGGMTIEGFSAAETVGEALAENGIALQDLDRSEPAVTESLPQDGVIRVVRVTEELLMQQSTIPYETQLLADDTLELGMRKVIAEGAVGISADRVTVCYEDGSEVSRVNEGNIVIAQPVTRVVHYGSKIVDKYMDTPDGPITYYMSVNVVATSYSPCRSGVPGKCYTGTSYGLPVQKGVIGVTRAWYYMFRGTQIYVPGYGVGTIADIGYYPYSDNWIDLGYSDADYQSWGSTNLTIYFLSPPPAGFSGVLP